MIMSFKASCIGQTFVLKFYCVEGFICTFTISWCKFHFANFINGFEIIKRGITICIFSVQ